MKREEVRVKEEKIKQIRSKYECQGDRDRDGAVEGRGLQGGGLNRSEETGCGSTK